MYSFMDSFNILTTFVAVVLCVVGVGLYIDKKIKTRRPVLGAPPPGASAGRRILGALDSFLSKYHVWLVVALMVVAVGVRFWQFPNIPPGLNQDEASIGYDSWAIGNYGIDRNGDPFPVYPIAHGDGHGPLYTYLSIPAIKIFGLSVFSYRLTNCLLGCVAVFVFYLLVKKIAGRTAGLCALALLATSPVSIMASRWALDGNPLPSVFIVAVFLFVKATEKGKTWGYMLSAAVFALCMYCYGPAGVVIPLFLILSCLYLIRHKKLKWPQFLCGIAAFAVVVAPLGIFMAINVFDWPAIRASFITFPKFTGMRANDVFIQPGRDYLGNLAQNVVNYFELVVFQTKSDLPWNMVSGFGTTYLFTAPLILLGAAATASDTCRLRSYNKRLFMFIYFVAATLMCILIRQNINRISILYPAVVFLIVMAVRFLYRRGKALAWVVCVMVAIGFGQFVHSYFNIYPETFGRAFFDSFGEAVDDAMERTDGTIYVTKYYQNVPHIIVLFHAKTPPQRYVETVVYEDDNAQWRNAVSFDRYRFGIPQEIDDATAVYVVDPTELERFDPEVFGFEHFRYYAVVYPLETG